jgi:hypothetical protein
VNDAVSVAPNVNRAASGAGNSADRLVFGGARSAGVGRVARGRDRLVRGVPDPGEAVAGSRVASVDLAGVGSEVGVPGSGLLSACVGAPEVAGVRVGRPPPGDAVGATPRTRSADSG